MAAPSTARGLFTRQLLHGKTDFRSDMSFFDTGPGLDRLHVLFRHNGGRKKHLHVTLQIPFGPGQSMRG